LFFSDSQKDQEGREGSGLSPGVSTSKPFLTFVIFLFNSSEPWGQIVSRFLSPEGLLLGITFTPSMRDEKI
jgi:hypothetical protein